jgi:hypothetical protein
LCTLRTTAGREWPDLQPALAPRLAAPLPASWLLAATEQRSRLRHLVFDAENPRSREREPRT